MSQSRHSQSCLDTFRRCNGEKGFCYPGTEPSKDRSAAGELATFIGKETLILVKGDEA
jgi:hypothetical protein